MRIVNKFDRICTFPEDFIISLLDFSYLYKLNNKNIKKMKKNKNPV